MSSGYMKSTMILVGGFPWGLAFLAPVLFFLLIDSSPPFALRDLHFKPSVFWGNPFYAYNRPSPANFLPPYIFRRSTPPVLVSFVFLKKHYQMGIDAPLPSCLDPFFISGAPPLQCCPCFSFGALIHTLNSVPIYHLMPLFCFSRRARLASQRCPLLGVLPRAFAGLFTSA